MEKTRKLSLVRTALKQTGKHLGHDEYAFFCPHHGSRSDRTVGQLGVNVSTDKWHCYSCGRGGTLLFLLPFKSAEWREYKESIEGRKHTEDKVETKKYEECVLPSEFRTLSKKWDTPYYNGAIKYLQNRGVDFSDILKWKLGYCEDGKYKNRIIFPSFDEFGELNFLTGRSFYDGPTRYWNGNYCKDIIFNDYLIDWRKPVVITEGPFDAIKVSYNAIALQGSLLSTGTKLFSKIVLSDVGVYLALDSDAFDKTIDIAKQFISYGISCRYVPLDGKKDVGEMTKSQFAAQKQKAILIKDDLDLLKIQLRESIS